MTRSGGLAFVEWITWYVCLQSTSGMVVWWRRRRKSGLNLSYLNWRLACKGRRRRSEYSGQWGSHMTYMTGDVSQLPGKIHKLIFATGFAWITFDSLLFSEKRNDCQQQLFLPYLVIAYRDCSSQIEVNNFHQWCLFCSVINSMRDGEKGIKIDLATNYRRFCELIKVVLQLAINTRI